MGGAALAKSRVFGYAFAVCTTAILTAILAPFRDEVGLLNQGLLFLLLTLIVAAVWGRNAGIFAAIVTNLALNFFFIEPHYQLTVQEPRNVVALVVFLIVSVLGSSLLSAAQTAAGQARRRQAETEVALTLSREMSGQTDPAGALQQLCLETMRAFDAPGAAVLTSSGGRWSVLAHAGSESAARTPGPDERSAADRASASGELQSLGRTGLGRTRARIVFPGGRKTAYSSERSVALVPLKVGDRVLGVLRLDGPIGDTPFRDQPEQLLSAIASEAALAVERAELAQAAAHAEALREADELKSALLNAVSHDLRTPLASIIASAGSLQQTDVQWTDEERLSFAEAIEHEALRLDRLVGNLLDLSRIESGSLKPDKGWYDLAALVGEVLGRLKPITARHVISVELAEDLPPIPLDYIEIDEVLTNLVENATKYTPPGSEIAIAARRLDEEVQVEVADRGPGIPAAALRRIFDPFYRVEGATARGTGLGLAVAKGLIEAHGGRIWVENRPDGGAKFAFTLPLSNGEETAAEEREP
ncbi:MAG TPA: ATP-binding protein [Dehalococcoidia bacterium]